MIGKYYQFVFEKQNGAQFYILNLFYARVYHPRNLY